ncbi:PREDICTED: GPI-anchor transamidase-like [Amphimedon queenslandica]|uniref:GPI-anchor transamidase n=1 Tax=Amphimedon queenslandica TaxID=400682 RepID=A0A1X7UVV9_AMPQE|nr:PREDICTED: GPI-anchor transamidase-like [Amphimedon queenslandica]|eukprot:XP_003386666.1 PREDICTED: GPI-anchor transamidase-like [Amphimedon queenslandica]
MANLWYICLLFFLARNSLVLSISSHTNNWAVLVGSSRYWFNYRHESNVLSIYHSVKRLGIPDSNIILMLADDMACDPRNPRPATIFNDVNQQINVYGDDIEVDYRGYEVTVENFVRVLTGRLDKAVSQSKRLLTNERSNVLVYMTGHGGDGFLKFQDHEEISNAELADIFQQMWQKRRYNELLFIIDTCHAESMSSLFYSPNIIGVGSSLVTEESFSHHLDDTIGVHIIDRWTYFALAFLEKLKPGSKATLNSMFDYLARQKVESTPYIRTDLFRRNFSEVLVTDFFGSVRKIELMSTSDSLPLPPPHQRNDIEDVVIDDGEKSMRTNQFSPPLSPEDMIKPT